MATALVTGASSGIGLAFCEQLAVRGHDLVLVARNRQRLEEKAQRIANYYGVKAQALVADLSTPEGRKTVSQRLQDEAHPISLLVNNAGFAPAQTFVNGDLERERRGMEVMVNTVMELSYVAAKVMRERKVGAIINVSSIVSGLPMGTYAAHKSWVEQFTHSLAQELRGSGVQVLCLKPGTTRTAFFEPLSLKLPKFSAGVILDPYQVAQRALDDLGRGRSESIPGLAYRALEVAKYLAPRPLVRKISSHIHHTRLSW